MCEGDVTLVVGAYDATVACLSFTAEKGLQREFRFGGHSGSVRTVAIHGQWLATGSTDETIRLYNLRDCSEIGSLVHHEGSVTWLSFSGGQLFSASEDESVAIWKTGTWNCTGTLTGHKGPVSCFAVHPSGKIALSVGRDRILRTWSISAGVAIFRQKLKEVAQLVRWSDGAKYYALAYRVSIELFCVQSGDIVSTISTGHSITSFVFISNEMIAVATEKPAIEIFSTASGDRVKDLKGHSQRVKSLAVLPEKNLLFSASSDGSVRVWKLTQSVADSVCMGVCETGSRLNCMALVPTAATTGTESGCDFVKVADDRRKGGQENTGGALAQHLFHGCLPSLAEPSCQSVETAADNGRKTLKVAGSRRKVKQKSKSETLAVSLARPKDSGNDVSARAGKRKRTRFTPVDYRNCRKHRGRQGGWARSGGGVARLLASSHRRLIRIRRHKHLDINKFLSLRSYATSN